MRKEKRGGVAVSAFCSLRDWVNGTTSSPSDGSTSLPRYGSEDCCIGDLQSTADVLAHLCYFQECFVRLLLSSSTLAFTLELV